MVLATPRRKRLVHVLSVPDSLVFLDGQVGFMSQHGYDVSVITSPGPGLFEFGTRNQVDVHAVEMPRKITPAEDLKAVATLRSRLRALHPDIVHAHTPKGGLLGMLAALGTSTTLRVYGMRGLPMQTAVGWRRALLRSTEMVSCGAAHQVVCESHSLRKVALAERLVAPAKIHVLANGSATGIDSNGRYNPKNLPADSRRSIRASLGISETSMVVGFVGRLVRDKGVTELVAAWREVVRVLPEAALLVVGTFEPRDPVAEVDRHYLETTPSVYLAGFRRDVAALYDAMDVVALPTYREGFPNVLLEAQAMERPVVATEVEGCVDAVVNGQTGLLVPTRDPAKLAAAILKYASDSSLRAEHGRAGRVHVAKHFERDLIWTALLERYESWLAERAR